jgi:hypothetical protein
MRTRPWTSFGLAALATALLAAPAAAQEGPLETSVPEIVGRVLGVARESGALDRALGERHLLLVRQTGRRYLTTVRCVLEEDPQLLRLTWIAQGLGTERGLLLEVSYGLELSGAVREVAYRRRLPSGGGPELSLEGKVADGQLTSVLVVHEEEQQTLERTAPWDEASLLPQGIALWILAPLFDQGLPEELRCTAFEGFEMRPLPGECLLRSSAVEGADDGAARVVELLKGGEERIGLRLTAEGQVLSGEINQDSLTPIDAAEATRLLEAGQ